MKTTWRKVSIAVALGVLVAAVGAPAQAGCPGSQLLDATFQYMRSNPNWCGEFGCYENDLTDGATWDDAPVTPNMKGVYWHVGNGNPAIGLGNDSGLFAGGFGPNEFWLKQVDIDFDGALYHYPAFISLKLGPQNVVGPPVTWSSPDADGCGPASPTPGAPPAQVCTCMLITDEWAGQGYFATLSARSDQLGNTNFLRGQDYVLAPIPPALVTGSSRDTGTGDVTVQVGLGGTVISGAPDSPAEGVFEADGCGTCLQGFQIFGAIVPRGGAPTDSQFNVLPRADGTPQGVTGYGGQVSVKGDCDPATPQDLFLAVSLVGEGPTPYTTSGRGVMGPGHMRVPCGSNMATPGGRDRGGRGDDSRRDRARVR
jgi:hypothetical protein